jgi:DNA-binding transcriptional regulator/RsmH inhibitor MraZ
MTAIVEADSKGRVLIPAEMRKQLQSNRFVVTKRGRRLELEPLPKAEELRGKYRKLIKADWEELEEQGEEFVSKQRR